MTDPLPEIKRRYRAALGGPLDGPWDVEEELVGGRRQWLVTRDGAPVARFYDETEARFYAHANTDVGTLLGLLSHAEHEAREAEARAAEKCQELVEDLGQLAVALGCHPNDFAAIAREVRDGSVTAKKLEKISDDRQRLFQAVVMLVLASGGEAFIPPEIPPKLRKLWDLRMEPDPRGALRVAVREQPKPSASAPLRWTVPNAPTGSTGGSWG